MLASFSSECQYQPNYLKQNDRDEDDAKIMDRGVNCAVDEEQVENPMFNMKQFQCQRKQYSNRSKN